MTMTRKPTSELKTWFCKIGEAASADVPWGGDFPMRRAIERAYIEITGEAPKFIFSGWGEELTEPERAAVENREPETHDNKGFSEEKCLRCGWIMGQPPLNCNNDDTPHRFPSQQRLEEQLEAAQAAVEQLGIQTDRAQDYWDCWKRTEEQLQSAKLDGDRLRLLIDAGRIREEGLQEQLSAYEDEINQRTDDQALTLRKLREEQERTDGLLEQKEATEHQADVMRDVLTRLRQWDVLNLPPGSGDDGPYWRGEIDRALSYPAISLVGGSDPGGESKGILETPAATEQGASPDVSTPAIKPDPSATPFETPEIEDVEWGPYGHSGSSPASRPSTPPAPDPCLVSLRGSELHNPSEKDWREARKCPRSCGEVCADSTPHSVSPSVTAAIQGEGGCGAIAPGGSDACLLDLDHPGPHGWEKTGSSHSSLRDFIEERDPTSIGMYLVEFDMLAKRLSDLEKENGPLAMAANGLEEQHEALLAEWRDYRATTDDVLKSMEEQLQSAQRKVDSYDRARARVKIEGATRAEYVLLAESALEQLRTQEIELARLRLIDKAVSTYIFSSSGTAFDEFHDAVAATYVSNQPQGQEGEGEGDD